MNDVPDVPTPIDVPLSGRYKRSFAYTTLKDRLPIILTKIVDQLSRTKEEISNKLGEGARDDIKLAVGGLSKLKNELQTNKPLVLLTSKKADVNDWNGYLKEEEINLGAPPCWFSTTWLLAECYMYRRVAEIFEKSVSLTKFDPFCNQKQDSLKNSLETMDILADYVVKILEIHGELNEFEIKEQLWRIIHANLWGNRCDLSISAGAEIIMQDNPVLNIDKFQQYVLVDDFECIWDTLQKDKGKNGLIDIIMDNSGYEAFTDFCLADFLCTFGLIENVRFHVKSLPWFVSDMTTVDFYWMLDTLSQADREQILKLAKRWNEYIQTEKWTVEENLFWTLPHDFSKMEAVNPALYKRLSESSLIIFKGDLNYRKLVGDINWDPTKPFSEALRGFHPSNLVTFRTIKADTVCGLAPGQSENVAKLSENWMISGEYGLIQFCS